MTRQPRESVSTSSTTVRSGPGTTYEARFTAPYGTRQYVFKHRVRDGRTWDYGYFKGRGWGYAPDWQTQ